MTYPVLTGTKCAELARQLLQGTSPAIEAFADWVGVGPEVDLGPIERAAALILAEMTSAGDSDKDMFEGRYCVLIHDALAAVPIEIRDDRGFWRFLALKYFWPFIKWREAEAFERENHLRYVDAASSTESVITRMHLRAAAVGGQEWARLAGGIPKSTDFWRSHILRVRTCTAPPVARAFASRQMDERLSTPLVRQVARRVNRTWTNVELHLYDDDEARDLIDDLWLGDAE
ncbi:MAG: hypothetical protein WD184_05320 [Acidimicrobiia bacterium]